MDLNFEVSTLADVCSHPAPKPFKSCPCGAIRKEIIGVTRTDVFYLCPSCNSSWLRSERCQACGAPAAKVINGFGACQVCASEYRD
jgi:hypothetical protein